MSEILYQADQKTAQMIIHHDENYKLNLKPGFQCSSVWSESDRGKLIDSILRSYPLPSVFLYKRYEAGNLVYDAIDGKQRIETLLFMGVKKGTASAQSRGCRVRKRWSGLIRSTSRGRANSTASPPISYRPSR